ncbi:hypothetical protein INT45_012393 [Circinella minor]|uniref:Methyltransferase domain-containing protein n=1 Tax=Circinella minor TaxID=1195481 RepID=A0A8H7VJK1_9FUNG|nr:hypothetical protein INT45_012393 [Circinella minor]
MGNLHSSFNDRHRSNVSTKSSSLPPRPPTPIASPPPTLPPRPPLTNPSINSPITSTTPPTPPTTTITPPSQLHTRPGFVRRTTMRLQNRLSTATTSTTSTMATTTTHTHNSIKKKKKRSFRNKEITMVDQNQHQHHPVITDDTNTYRLGRRHQNINTKYILPNDEVEQDRLTNLHFVLKHCFNGNYSAPIQDLLQQPSSSSPSWSHKNASTTTLPHGSIRSLSTRSTHSLSGLSSAMGSGGNKMQPRVLDIACGTGIWILEMASEFPQAQFYGIDLSTMYPADIKPLNTHFCQGDVLNGLPYLDNYFDYVHMSLVYNCFSFEDRKKLLNEIRRVLKPGGYVEFRDVDPIVRNPGPYTIEYIKPFSQLMHDKLDVDITWATNMCEHVQKFAGMTDLHHQVVSINFVSSSKLSTTFITALLAEWESYRSFSMDAYDLTSEEYSKVTQTIIEESKKQRSYLNYIMCWGRKPIVDVPSNTSIQHEYGTPPHISRYRPTTTTTTTIGTSSSPRQTMSNRTSIYNNNSVTSSIQALSSSTPTRLSPKSGTQCSSSLIPSSKNSPQSLRSKEEAIRRDKENASDIYQFVHGYIE